MIKKGKKIISLICVVFLITLTLVPGAMAVEYPDGVTKQQISATVGKTDALIEALISSTPEGSLEKLILPELYKNEVLSSLTVGIYKAIEENAESISSIGIDVSVKGVAANLSGYPKVQEKLLTFSKWSEVDLGKAKWGVKDKAGFIDAVSSVLSPFNDVLYMLLCGGNYSLNPVIGLKGAKGYETAIIPTLKALGCETVTDSAVFYAQAKENRKSMLTNILGDIFVLAERICASPCDTLTDILPSIADFMENGGLDNAVTTLMEPLRLQFFNISTFIKVETILSFISDSESFTQNFTLNFNDILSGTGLKAAEINLQELASCGAKGADGSIQSDKAATFTVLMRWLIDTAKLNKDSLKNMLGEEAAELSGAVDNLMTKDTDDIIELFVRLLNAEKGTVNDYVWTFANFEGAQVNYTANLSKEKFQRVVDGIDELLDQVIAEGGEYKTFREALAPEIYSNALVSTLVCEIYKALSSEDLKAVGAIAGLDITPASLANELTESRFANTRYALSRASSWSKVNPNTLTWGFKNGDKDGFVKAVCAALRPMEDIVTMLLCEGKVQLMGCIDIYGSNGYNTAVIPLFEALGCSNDSILTYKEYKKAAEKGEGIEAIVNALMSLVERVLDRPVYTVTEILPNLLYFINNKGIETCLENLMYPLTSLLKEFGMENMLDMSAMVELDLNKMLNDILKDNELGIDLSGFDIEQYAKMGELVTVKSKRVQNGEFVNISYIKADQTAIMVSLMRYIAEMFKNPETDIIGELMGSAAGENPMVSSFVGGISEDLDNMTVDETVEWMYKLLFRERPIVEEKPAEEYLPTIIYEPEGPAKDTVIYTALLIVALCEIIYIKERVRINRYVNRKSKDFRKFKKKISQEV